MQTNGTTHFENDIYGTLAQSQANSFVMERYGGFLQGAFKF